MRSLGSTFPTTRGAYNGRHDGSVSNHQLARRTAKALGIDENGKMGFIDLGDAALDVPDRIVVAREELRRVLKDRYESGLASITDPDVTDQRS